MPIYEYGCEHCGHKLETMQRISDEPLKTCPECNQESLRKLVSLTSFHLKGGGWYKDHYGIKPGASSGDSSPLSTASGSADKSSHSDSSSPAPESTPSSTPSPSSAGASTSSSSSSAVD